MNKNDPSAPRSLLQRMTQWFNDLRLMLVAAARAFKALGRSVQQVVLLSIAIMAVLHHNDMAAELLRKAVHLLASA